MPYRAILEGASTVAAAAAAELVRLQSAPRAVSRKELLDVVTDADLAAERIVLDGLRRLTPDAAFLSEEAGAIGSPGEEPGEERWIVDPLDGTVNYAAGLPWFSVTMAYQRGGSTRVGVVHAPSAGLVASYAEGGTALVNGGPVAVSQVAALADAVVSVVLTSSFDADTVGRTAAIVRLLGQRARGVRVIVSGGLELCLVACGRLDAWVSLQADIVSHAAAMPLLRAAGGRITRLDGSDAGDDDTVRVASNGHLHEELLQVLRGAS